jgi:ABC-2 type transport system ATP-binding protein
LAIIDNSTNDEFAISVSGLRKSYGSNDAVKGIDLNVKQGEVFALLGPNGAGKTTTVEILEGHRNRDAGEVCVLGHDPRDGDADFRERIGIVLQSAGVEPYLSVEETVNLYRGFYANPRATDEVLDVTGLTELRNSRVRKLSGGQQRRLDVAVGLAGNPELLFLDEPTTGFDPIARRDAWDMITNLRSLGKTVLLTTHYMDEAENLADRVALIVSGRIVTEGTPGELTAMDSVSTVTFVYPEGQDNVPEAIQAGSDAKTGVVTIKTPEPTKVLSEITSWASNQNIELERLSVSRASLEDVYVDLVRSDVNDEAKQ